jgi:hypothetical protein
MKSIDINLDPAVEIGDWLSTFAGISSSSPTTLVVTIDINTCFRDPMPIATISAATIDELIDYLNSIDYDWTDDDIY